MKHLTLFVVVLVAFMALTAQPATLQETPYTSGRAPAFEQVDLNSDGAISPDEALSTHVLSNEYFRAADRDHDGSLNKDEYNAALRAFATGERRLT